MLRWSLRFKGAIPMKARGRDQDQAEGKLNCNVGSIKLQSNQQGTPEWGVPVECPISGCNDSAFVLRCHLFTRFTRSPRKGWSWARRLSAAEVDLEVAASQRLSANCIPWGWAESLTLKRGCWEPFSLSFTPVWISVSPGPYLLLCTWLPWELFPRALF